jgi:dolichyl-phosphate-mannose--protein O-mannosyl transferase
MRTLSFLFFCLILKKISSHLSEEEIQHTVEDRIITYGSILRIQNVMTKFHLHSHPLTWGSGSRQQSITGVQAHDDPNSLWMLKEALGSEIKEVGTPLKCGDLIRLEHVNTGKNLHSHNFPSFITDSQEASGFGEDGTGDLNDNFILMCKDDYEGNSVKGASKFYLYHKPTSAYVYINIRKSLFNEYNCRGCPILGQREVSLSKSLDMQAAWKVVGVII